MATDGSAGEGAGALAGVAATSGTQWPQRGQGELKTPPDVPKSSAGWQPQPWHSGDPAGSGAGAAFNGIPMGCARGEQTAGEASGLLRGTKEAGKLGFLGGFSIRNTRRNAGFAPFPDRKSLGEVH